MAPLTACDPAPGNPDHGGDDLSAPTVSVPVGEGSGRDAVAAAYDEFWDQTHQIPHDPESTWDDSLADVAVNPQRKITMQGMRLARERGITSYGEVISRISDIKIDGDTATVVDCQDASNSGQRDLKTGKKKTVGVERNPVRARLERHGGEWKVAKVTYPGGDC